mmetsp:Transcript_129785/g.276993  ORF Transcript_129785/g.276993 Transcript_129785/m.276993 type:complete len:141 (+) Transcript_129785:184-606(+)
MGAGCCSEFENGKLQEDSMSIAKQAGQYQDGIIKEVNLPAAVASIEDEALAEKKKLAAAAKIQANFRGTKDREKVKEKRECMVVQHHEDPDLRNIDLGGIQLQNKPNRVLEPGVGGGGGGDGKLSPRTIAAFDGRSQKHR